MLSRSGYPPCDFMTTYVPAAAAVIIILTFIVGFTGLVISYLRAKKNVNNNHKEMKDEKTTKNNLGKRIFGRY